MEAILALLQSAESRAALAFLMSEFRAGVTYYAAMRQGELTEAEVAEHWTRGHLTWLEGEAAIDKALAERAAAKP